VQIRPGENSRAGADQGGEQAGAVGFVQVIQGPADAVVVEQAGLPGQQADGSGDAARGPVGDGVQRLPRQQEVGEQQARHAGGRQGGRAPGQRRQVAVEQPGQVEAGEEEADQGGGADLEGLQADALRQGRGSHGHLASKGERPRGQIGQAQGLARAKTSWPGWPARLAARPRLFSPSRRNSQESARG